MTLLVVVAHPDDETFACGSLLLAAASAGIRTVVVCAGRGEAGEVREGVDLPAGGIAELRETELRAAADLLGVAEVEVLGLVDSGMGGEPPAGSVCAEAPEALAARVADAVARHRPEVLAGLAGDDGHRDHLAVRAALTSVALEQRLPLYLQCLPRSLMHEWILSRAGDEHSAAYVELPDIGTPDGDLTTVLDSGAHYEQRLAAIAVHHSQRSPYDDLPEDLRRRFLATEHLVRVGPSAPVTPAEYALLGSAARPPTTTA
ncbi:PIG-L deacetylase family protein [Phycicoccus flavus]|uniref:PIG-L deacetylase family protein n=1 Tax=Phycicoccus flavus TaxID=2502783 RepID=UPI000FEC05C6|nr:PIG-L deacetylase family protein [Phycicoccus flavus]NHA66498.1 hypothetical protein [Phycicoccus flavus]